MAVTLTDALKTSQDELAPFVVEELVKACPLQKLLTYKEIEGNALTYNREDPTDIGTMGFVGINERITEDTAKTVEVTTSLKKIVKDADVDNLIVTTMSKRIPAMRAQVRIKTKLAGHTFEDQAVYGVAATSKGFDGMHTLCSAAQTLTTAISATPAALSLSDHLDAAVDMVNKLGKPTGILLSRAMLRAITKYLRDRGSLQQGRDEYGNQWSVWGDNIPFVPSDIVLNTELCSASGIYSAKTGGTSTSIFVFYVADEEGLVGLQGDGGIKTETWDRLEEYDASRTRIKWYPGMALYSTLALARICNINPATAVAA